MSAPTKDAPRSSTSRAPLLATQVAVRPAPVPRAPRASLPPGPRLPSALQAVAWLRRPLPFLERCQRHYGDTFTLRVRNTGTWVVLADPADVKLVFTADQSSLGVGIANSILGPLLGPRSVMLLEEPEHVLRRRLMLPHFHGERIGDYGEMMAEATRREVSRWPLEEPFELWPRMQRLTLEAIMRVVFGGVEGERLRGLRESLRTLTDWMNDPRRLRLIAAAGPRRFAGNRDYRSVMAPVEEAVLEEVRARRKQPHESLAPRHEVASMLAQARYEDGSPMTERDLRDELVTLLTDGPTSGLLTWAFERLVRHPEALVRLHDDLDASGADGAYLDAVVKETLRLCPAAPIVVRRLLEPMPLGGYEIPAGTTVAPCAHLVHRNPDTYPEPLEFLPERFLKEPPGKYTWIPFGGGVRRCLAAPYAQLLMKRVIGTVLEEVDLRPAHPHPERPEKSAITFVPHLHGLVVASPRGLGQSRDRAEPAVEVDGGSGQVRGAR